MAGMTDWAMIAGLAITTFIIRAIGPLALGGRDLPRVLARVVPMLAPAIIAALIAVDTFGGPGESLTVDARAAGFCAAALALVLRAPILVVVAFAAATTAVVRLLV